jgi:hypothetical protein
MLALKIGCDPELFLSKGEQVVSAYGLIPGTKKEPYAVRRGSIQVDGTAAEIGIDPADNKNDWLVSLEEVLQQLQAQVPDLTLRIQATVDYDPAYLASLPQEARELGCDPDYNAYTMQPNPSPNGNLSLRSAGGHIHLGWCSGVSSSDAGHQHSCAALVRQCDFFLGMPSLLWDNSESAIKRRQLYGKAGAYRAKSYGVEYRTLSNKWLENEWLRGWAFDNATAAFKSLAEEGQDFFAIHGSVAQSIIDNNDVEGAMFWCHKLGINTGLRQ